MDGGEFNHIAHPNEMIKVNLGDLMLYLDDYVMNMHDPFVCWVGIRKAKNGTMIRKLVDNCGSERQKIWYTVFEVDFGLTSTGRAVWKGEQSVYRLRHCMDSMSILQDQLSRPAASLCTFPSRLDGWRLQCLQLQVLSLRKSADCSFSARFLPGRDASTLR